MTISDSELEHIATLARLHIDASERPALAQSLTNIVELVATLQAQDTEGVEPLANPLDASQPLRDDEVTEGNRREAFQAIAPAVENGFYLVPKVIE
jgi:aspartyl-tRNA(Asn)/glutamyl-tRNA(Gln) amidotransferase subunit C